MVGFNHLFQTCAFCKLALLNSVGGRALIKAFNSGILFLLVVPFLLIGFLLFLLFYTRWRSLGQLKNEIEELFASNPYFRDKKSSVSMVWGITVFLIVFVAVTSGIGIWLGAEPISPPKKLSVDGKVPKFTLIDQDGKLFSSKSLIGKVWVLDFFLTRCTSECPIDEHHMALLEKKFASNPRVSFVSISVDPKFDTPSVLKKYIKQNHFQNKNWFFLTGTPDEIRTLVLKKLHLMLVYVPHETLLPHKDPGIIHSMDFVLVDPEGRIRGYFNGSKLSNLLVMKKDISELLRNIPGN
jgi:protein SCO1/2